MLEKSQQFDEIILSPYSTQLEAVKNGSAKFLRQLLDHTPNVRFLVLNAYATATAAVNGEKNVSIKPAWKKNSPFPFFQVLRVAKLHKNVPIVANFEFNAFGGMLGLLGFAITWFLLWLSGRRNLKVILHPALLSRTELLLLSEHLSVRFPTISTSIYAIGMRLYVAFLVAFAEKVVVFEENFKKRIVQIHSAFSKKIIVIPHQIYGTGKTEAATRKLKSKALKILFFGFIVPYKGVDTLVSAAEKLSPSDFDITIAGGMSPTQTNREYFTSLIEEIKKNNLIQYLGYRPDNEVPSIFAAADLLVLPYKNLIASSGPMAWGIGMKKAFIISGALSPYIETKDFQDAMQNAQISHEDVVYGTTTDDLIDHLLYLKQVPEKLQKLQLLSHELAKTRDINFIIEKYRQLFW